MIVGVGFVGVIIVYVFFLLGFVVEIVFIDIDMNCVLGEVIDMSYVVYYV